MCLAVVALFFGGHVSRIVPGGPFISVTGDVLPFFAALAAIALGFLCLRSHDAAHKLFAVILILIATIAVANITVDVYSFWHRPAARGSLWGL